jgi:hypothetical protein
VTLTTTVQANQSGHARFELTLTDADGLRVTGQVDPDVTLKDGDNPVTFTIKGGFLGDSGVNGPYTATLTGQEVTASGAVMPGSSKTSLGGNPVGVGWKAEEFADYVPSLQRIWNRVDEFHGLSMLGASTRTQLQQDLRNPNLTTAVHDFRQHLTAAKGSGLNAEAFTRLDSLAARLQAAPSAAGPAPAEGRSAPPGPDPVRAS